VGKKLVPYLSGMTPLTTPIRVKVADDRELRCTEVILNCPWETQGHTFTTDLKVLQLGAFDLILGQDWLYAHSPTNIDWPTKRLRITDNGREVFLQGAGATTIICNQISVEQL
jgi:hypothetical protein